MVNLIYLVLWFDNCDLEINALSINHMWQTREYWKTLPPSTVVYDDDMNITIFPEIRNEETILYRVKSNNLPCVEMENLVRVLASDPHQALLLWHITIQGIIYPSYTYNKQHFI